MRKLIVSLFLGLMLTACDPTQVKSEVPAGAITCTNHQDTRLNFSYLPEKATQWYSEEYKVNVFWIETIEGKRISVNSLELENYTCK